MYTKNTNIAKLDCTLVTQAMVIVSGAQTISKAQKPVFPLSMMDSILMRLTTLWESIKSHMLSM